MKSELTLRWWKYAEKCLETSYFRTFKLMRSLRSYAGFQFSLFVHQRITGRLRIVETTRTAVYITLLVQIAMILGQHQAHSGA